MTRNITLAIPETDLHGIRIYAAHHKTTVNSLVREFVHTLASKEDRVAQARKDILALAEKSTAKRGKAKWTREELYER